MRSSTSMVLSWRSDVRGAGYDSPPPCGRRGQPGETGRVVGTAAVVSLPEVRVSTTGEP